MVPDRIEPHVVATRMTWVQRIVAEIRALPLAEEELYEICAQHLDDVEQVAAALREWVKDHVIS